jgi:sec-independent protein translocase protein TatB
MLFDLGWSEILLIGTVALIFIGPKDLPKALRLAGFWVRKARTLSREFQSSIDQMIREAELEEVRQDLKKATEFDLDKEFHNTIDPTGSLNESLKLPDMASISREEGSPAPVSESTAGLVVTAAAEVPAPLQPASGDTAPSTTAAAETASAEPAISEPAAQMPPNDIAHDIVPPKP